MAPTVVLLHGFATSTERTWREPGWFDLLKEAGRRARGIDLLGHGEAAKPRDPAAYDDLTSPVLEQFPSRPADLVGYSLGARVALDIASRFPDRVNRLVLAGVGRNVVTEHEGGLDDHISRHFEQLITAPGNDVEALRACVSRPRRAFTAEALATITAECLVVIGDQDMAGPPEPLAELLPNATVVVLPGVDHFGLPKQIEFIDTVLQFIDAVPDWS